MTSTKTLKRASNADCKHFMQTSTVIISSVDFCRFPFSGDEMFEDVSEFESEALSRVRIPKQHRIRLSTTTQLARDNLWQQIQQLNKTTQIGVGTVFSETLSLSSTESTTKAVTSTTTAFSTVLTPQVVSQPTATPTQTTQLMLTPQPGQQKKRLSLTREQLLEAREMFRTSNKVTRPERVIILGFIAGSRENPCPQKGSVLSIRLRENKEMVTQLDSSEKAMIADTFFQMNYQTGEWKRIKKYRECNE